MNAVAQVFAVLAALVHITAFVWEVLLFDRPAVHQGTFKIPSGDVPAVRLWSFNVGFYNLFLAAAPITGVIAWHAGSPAVARALVLYGCAFMFLAGLVLAVSDRMALSRPKGAGVPGALAQSLPSLVALVAVLAS
jgi:putative membrane protein